MFKEVEPLKPYVHMVVTKTPVKWKKEFLLEELQRIHDESQMIKDGPKKIVSYLLETKNVHLFPKPRQDGEYTLGEQMKQELLSCNNYLNLKQYQETHGQSLFSITVTDDCKNECCIPQFDAIQPLLVANLTKVGEALKEDLNMLLSDENITKLT